MGYLSAKQQQEAGMSIVTAQNLQNAQEAWRNAEAARSAVRTKLQLDPNWMPDHDPNKRD